jgi:alpha-L-fucosidase
MTGHRNADRWLPAECDVSIRPGWFWHAAENEKVKTPRQLLDLYYKSVGRGGSFLLNVPPDQRGRAHENDVASLAEFGRLVGATFRTNLAAKARITASNARGNDDAYAAVNVGSKGKRYWATDDGVTTPELVIDVGKEMRFNVVRLREHIALGQRIDAFALDAWQDEQWREFATGTSVGSCRIVRTAADVTTSKVRLRIVKAAACPCVSEVGLYREAE